MNLVCYILNKWIKSNTQQPVVTVICYVKIGDLAVSPAMIHVITTVMIVSLHSYMEYNATQTKKT